MLAPHHVTGMPGAAARVSAMMGATEPEAVHALMPHSVLTVVGGAGHLPGVGRPEAFDRALSEFLAGR